MFGKTECSLNVTGGTVFEEENSLDVTEEDAKLKEEHSVGVTATGIVSGSIELHTGPI
jgi:hypothetical protein